MGIAKKTDGRYLVGVGVNSVNDYKGSAAYRDIYIQLTSSGATAKSEEYLTFLKDYGFHANASGEPIMPPSVNVWISNNGVTTAVEADDVSIDGNNYTICGIKWNGSTWDYSAAGQGKSGSGLPPYTSADKGKALTIGEDGEHPVQKAVVPEQSVTLESGGPINLATFGVDSGVDFDFFENASVGDKCYISIGGADAVESTAENVYGQPLFPVGNYYVGYSSMFNGTGVASFTETGSVTVSAYAITLPIVADWRDIMFVLNKNFMSSVEGETTELYAMLKAAYDEGATLYIRDTSSYSTGEIFHMDYDADNDKFVARVSWIFEDTVVNLYYGTYTIDPLKSLGERTVLYKVEMSIP